MREYIIGLIVCSLFASILCFIVPNENLGKVQRFVAGICIICVSVKPVSQIVVFIREFDIKSYISEQSGKKYEDMWEDYLEGYGEDAVREYICVQIREMFGCEVKKIDVSYNSGEQISIRKIYIELPHSAMLKDTAKMEMYFEKIFDCDVVIAIE